MPTDMELSCPQCYMPFPSRGLLAKHRTQFCIGPPSVEPPELTAQKMISDFHIEELETLKRRKAALRRERDELERQLLEANTSGRRSKQQSEDEWDRRSAELRLLQQKMSGNTEITDDKTDRRDRAKADNPPKASSFSSPAKPKHIVEKTKSEDTEDDDCRSVHSAVSSLSIALPSTPSDDSEPSQSERMERERRQQLLKDQAECFSQRLARCRSRGNSLQAQKLELEQRIHDLALGSSRVAPPVNSTHLLDQLTAQQEKNQLALMQLQQQFNSLNKTSPLVTSDDYLVKEINAMRLRYLQTGGNNPEILMYIAKMEEDAIALASKHGQIVAKSRQDDGKYKSASEQLIALELENQRLQDELASLHEANTEALQFSGLDDEEFVRALATQQESHLSELLALERDVELTSQRARLEMLKRKLNDMQNDSDALTTIDAFDDLPTASISSARSITAVGEPTPYDPSSGLVVFYDFVGGFQPPPSSTVQLASTIYRALVPFSAATVLPATVTVSGLPSDTQLGTVSVIGARQPIIHCPASSDIVLILELQTTAIGGRSSATRAWCQVPLFSNSGWIMSGCWRIPFRMPPIDLLASSQSGMTSDQRYGGAEVFLRVVNQTDADLQSLVKVSPAEHKRYCYPSSSVG